MSPLKRSSLFEGSNLIFFGALALLLFALYYYRADIPSMPSSDSPKLAADSEHSGTLVASGESSTKQLTPLEKIISEIDSGHYGAPRYRASQNFRVSQLSEEGEPAIDPRVSANWDSVASTNFIRALQESKARADEMIQSTPRENFNARSALVSHVQGIDFILSRPDQLLSAAEAMAYIDHLHLKVAEAMSDDGIDRQKRRAWDRLAKNVRESGESVVKSVKEQKAKDEETQKIVVTDVAVTPGTTLLSVSGLIKGLSVDRVLVSWNGSYYAAAQTRPGKNEATLFHFQAQDGRGDFSIRAIDKNGFSINREYRFFE